MPVCTYEVENVTLVKKEHDQPKARRTYICLRFAVSFTIAAAIFEAMKMATSGSQCKQGLADYIDKKKT